MDTNQPTTIQNICPQCHQPVLPEYYFCPNCGKNLHEAPLPTTIGAQLWLYVYSLIFMPLTAYLIYRRWEGIKYFKSKDPKAHTIGIISIILLILSFVIIAWEIWQGTLWLQQAVQSQQNLMNLGGGIQGL